MILRKKGIIRLFALAALICTVFVCAVTPCSVMAASGVSQLNGTWKINTIKKNVQNVFYYSDKYYEIKNGDYKLLDPAGNVGLYGTFSAASGKGYVTAYDPLISDPGYSTDVIFTKTDYGFTVFTSDDEEMNVFTPFFQDIFCFKKIDLQGNTLSDSSYVVMDNGVSTLYNYGSQKPVSSFKFSCKDGQYYFENRAPRKLAITDYGFVVADPDRQCAYVYTRYFNGTWGTAGSDGSVGTFNSDNGAFQTQSGSNKVYGSLWYHNGQLGSYTPGNAYNQVTPVINSKDQFTFTTPDKINFTFVRAK